jgi:phenylalanyl-tRNA synthetase beta subunit
LEFVPQAGSQAPWELAGEWVEIRRGGRAVGGLGVLTGPILQTVAHEGQVVWFELAMDELDAPIYPQLEYVAPPVYPGSWQDFSLVWDVGQGYAALDERLGRFTHPLVMRREFLYLYKGKGLSPGTGSYSFRYWLGALDHTLASEEIDGFRTALLGFLKEQGLSLRG